MAILQSTGAKYRFWAIVNGALWSIYDVASGAYNALITHAIQLGFTLVSALVYDLKKSKKIPDSPNGEEVKK